MDTFQWMVCIDGLTTSWPMLRHMVGERVEPEHFENNKVAQKTLEKGRQVYQVPLLLRYVLYMCMTMVYCVFEKTTTIDQFLVIMIAKVLWCTVCTDPTIQRWIVEKTVVSHGVKTLYSHCSMCSKYIVSKCVLLCIRNVHADIVDIPNYHIFLLYKQIHWTSVRQLSKTVCLVLVMRYLRTDIDKYVWYKVLKIAYYYNSGHVFSTMTKEQAVIELNDIILNKKWSSWNSVETVNSIYTLVRTRVQDVAFTMSFQFGVVMAIWSVFYTVHVMNVWLKSVYWTMYCAISVTTSLSHYIVLCGMIMMTEYNPLMAALMMYFQHVFEYIISEIVFYSGHYHRIQQCIRHIR